MIFAVQEPPLQQEFVLRERERELEPTESIVTSRRRKRIPEWCSEPGRAAMADSAATHFYKSITQSHEFTNRYTTHTKYRYGADWTGNVGAFRNSMRTFVILGGELVNFATSTGSQVRIWPVDRSPDSVARPVCTAKFVTGLVTIATLTFSNATDNG